MSRYSDDWIEDRLIFSLYGGGGSDSSLGCSCGCGPIEYLESMKLSIFLGDCSELDESEQSDIDKLLSWPIELKEKIWRSRVRWRLALKAEKSEIFQKILRPIEFQRSIREYWNSLTIKEKKKFFTFSLNSIHSIIPNIAGGSVDREFVEFSLLIIEQILNFGLTAFEPATDADGDADEILFQKFLRFDPVELSIYLDENYFLPSTDNSDPILRRMPEFFRSNLVSKKKLDENEKKFEAKKIFSLPTSTPYRMQGQKSISAFRSDRRIMRLAIFRESIKRIIEAVKVSNNRENERKVEDSKENKSENNSINIDQG